MKLTRKCAECKQDIRKEEMLQYASPTGKTLLWYCKECYEEKLARERFSNKVCQIFQLKSPGPVIWTQRKRLREKYGYTDDAIVDCLEFLYDVKKVNKLAETLGLVNPRNMEATRAWKAQQRALGGRLLAAQDMVQVEKKIIEEMPETKSAKKEIRLDDGLFDE